MVVFGRFFPSRGGYHCERHVSDQLGGAECAVQRHQRRRRRAEECGRCLRHRSRGLRRYVVPNTTAATTAAVAGKWGVHAGGNLRRHRLHFVGGEYDGCRAYHGELEKVAGTSAQVGCLIKKSQSCCLSLQNLRVFGVAALLGHFFEASIGSAFASGDLGAFRRGAGFMRRKVTSR